MSDLLLVINVFGFVIGAFGFVIKVCVFVIKLHLYAGMWAGFVMGEFVSVMSDAVLVIVELPS